MTEVRELSCEQFCVWEGSKAVPGDCGSRQEENLGRKVKTFVGGCADLSEAWFPSTCLGCDPCLCGPDGCQHSGGHGGVRHQNRGRARRRKTKTRDEG